MLAFERSYYYDHQLESFKQVFGQKQRDIMLFQSVLSLTSSLILAGIPKQLLDESTTLSQLAELAVKVTSPGTQGHQDYGVSSIFDVHCS